MSRYQTKLLFYLFQSLIFPSTLITSQSSGLYDGEKDGVKVLNERNFQAYFTARTKDVVVQYYLDTCGHCRRFSPTFKQFVRLIQPWKGFLEVAVLNCNTEYRLCSRIGLRSFPLVYYHPLGSSNVIANRVKISGETVETLYKSVFEAAAKIHSKDSKWQPMKVPIHGSANKDGYFVAYTNQLEDKFSSPALEIFLFFKDCLSDGHTLYWTKQTFDSHAKYNLDFYDATNSPTRLAAGNFIDKFSIQLNETLSKKFPGLSCRLPLLLNGNKSNKVWKNSVNGIQMDAVYRDDIEKTLITLLRVDVPLAFSSKPHTMHSTMWNTLKQLLEVIVNNMLQYMSPEMSLALGRLTYRSRHENWGKNNYADSWEKILKEIEMPTATAYEWKACKGSQPQYRGYPCGLWTLFHSLTVTEFARFWQNNETQSSKALTIPQVPMVMRLVITQFFSCTQCAHNFEKESRSLMIQKFRESMTYRGSVLWLWKIHNRVNMRLKGDATDDPKYPKQLFPPERLCRNAKKWPNEWNTEVVFWCLYRHYRGVAWKID